MNKAIIAAGLLLALGATAHADGKYPPTGQTLPPAKTTPEPQIPVYWGGYFDTMFDDSMDVTAGANARNDEELSRDGWNRHHKGKVKKQP